MIIGSVCDLISFGFAPMSLLAPLGAMTLVVNMFVAPCFLNESLSRRDVIWTLVEFLFLWIDSHDHHCISGHCRGDCCLYMFWKQRRGFLFNRSTSRFV